MDHPESHGFDAYAVFEVTEDELDTVRAAIADFRGGQVQAWSYHVSHCWFAIRLTRSNIPGNLHLCCGTCFFVAFDPCYDEGDIAIAHGVDSEGARCFVVSDGKRLKVCCLELRVKRDVEPVYNRPRQW
jgi:hypothetical protein